MRLPFVAAVAAIMFTTLAAHADPVRYDFQFSNASNGAADFSFAIDEPSLIRSLNLEVLATPRSTPFGFSVNYFAESRVADFALSSDKPIIGDTYIALIRGTIAVSFQNTFDYLGFGQYKGNFDLDQGGPFPTGDIRGDVLVTVTDLGPVAGVTPEPSTVALLGSGLLGVFAVVPRRHVNA